MKNSLFSRLFFLVTLFFFSESLSSFFVDSLLAIFIRTLVLDDGYREFLTDNFLCFFCNADQLATANITQWDRRWRRFCFQSNLIIAQIRIILNFYPDFIGVLALILRILTPILSKLRLISRYTNLTIVL